MATTILLDSDNTIQFSGRGMSFADVCKLWEAQHFLLNCPVEQYGNCECRCSTLEAPATPETLIGLVFECKTLVSKTRCVVYGTHEHLVNFIVYLRQYPGFEHLFQDLFDPAPVSDADTESHPGQLPPNQPDSQLIPVASGDAFVIPCLANGPVKGKKMSHKHMNHPLYNHPIHNYKKGADIHKKGQFHETKIKDLMGRHKYLKAIPVEKRTPRQQTELRQIDFAIRAKRGWTKGKI